MILEQIRKIEEYLKGLSDSELSELISEFNNVTHEETSQMRKTINHLYADNVGIFALRVTELVFPCLKELHTRWTKI